MRTSVKRRETKETKVLVEVNLDAAKELHSYNFDIQTGNAFFSHMLEQFAHKSCIDLKIEANSLDFDMHHLVEDVAITLGGCIFEALGEKNGIKRYGQRLLPMDEALILCAIDLSGRGFLEYDVDIAHEKTSGFETCLIRHFFLSLSNSMKMTLHIKKISGLDPHHIVEGIFKAFGKALREAIEFDESSVGIPSTKGVL